MDRMKKLALTLVGLSMANGAYAFNLDCKEYKLDGSNVVHQVLMHQTGPNSFEGRSTLHSNHGYRIDVASLVESTKGGKGPIDQVQGKIDLPSGKDQAQQGKGGKLDLPSSQDKTPAPVQGKVDQTPVQGKAPVQDQTPVQGKAPVQDQTPCQDQAPAQDCNQDQCQQAQDCPVITLPAATHIVAAHYGKIHHDGVRTTKETRKIDLMDGSSKFNADCCNHTFSGTFRPTHNKHRSISNTEKFNLHHRVQLTCEISK